MKIALLLASNRYFCPYAQIYTKILDDKQINYDIIFWDRDGLNELGGLAFKKSLKSKSGRIIKFIKYIQYTSFLKKVINKNNYDKLIVYGPQIGIFLYSFLKHRYKNKFILDYRDLSFDQIFKRTFIKLLTISNLNIISSPGFLKYLPKQFNYIISHNFDIDKVKTSLTENSHSNHLSQQIEILTIGSIRNYNANLSLIKALANNNQYIVRFVGKGPASELLKKYVYKNNITNVEFHGFYKKKEESEFIKRCSFMNIFYPKIKSHSSALSNRFYNALINKKPMIVTSHSTQGDYVTNFKLGLSLDNCNNLDHEIQMFLCNVDKEKFALNCDFLLEEFVNDYDRFSSNILKFLSDKI
jgi:hypothetical protein